MNLIVYIFSGFGFLVSLGILCAWIAIFIDTRDIKKVVEPEVQTRRVKRKFNIGKTEVRVTFEDKSVFSVHIYGSVYSQGLTKCSDGTVIPLGSNFVYSSLDSARNYINNVLHGSLIENSNRCEFVTEVRKGGNTISAKIYGTEDYEVEEEVLEVM